LLIAASYLDRPRIPTRSLRSARGWTSICYRGVWMALRIRLRRMGRRNAPTYRVVVAESSMPRDGRIVESIGHYNPRTEPLTLVVDRARALYWINLGATPTDTVQALLKRAGIYRPEEPAVVAAAGTVVAGAKKAGGAVKGAAGKVAGAVKGAAGGVAHAAAAAVGAVKEVGVVEAVKEVASDVREAAASVVDAVIHRGDDAEAPAAEAGAAPAAEAEATAADAGAPAAETETPAAAEEETPA